MTNIKIKTRAKPGTHFSAKGGINWCTACDCACDPWGRFGPCGCCE